MDTFPLPVSKELTKAAGIFSQAGYQCWLVGGAVRDAFLGRASDDYDLATDATPERVRQIFRRTIPTGMKHGTITVLLGGRKFETTTFRRDGDYSDGRRPDSISYADNIFEDLSRRDFTINAIAYNLIDNCLADPHNGREDLKRKIIRAIGNPADRLEEDGLRSIRACRFAGQLGFVIHRETKEAISSHHANIPGLSAERIWVEFKKIMTVPAPSISIDLFRETGLLNVLLPELEAYRRIDAGGFKASLRCCDSIRPGNIPLRFAALLQGTGTIDSRKTENNAAAEAADVIFRRYKASNAHRERTVRLLQEQFFNYSRLQSDAELRRFIFRAGLDLLDDLLALKFAQIDASSLENSLENRERDELTRFSERIHAIRSSGDALSLRDLAVNGSDLMAELHIKKGPGIGRLLNQLLEKVLEKPELNNRESLIKLAKDLG